MKYVQVIAGSSTSAQNTNGDAPQRGENSVTRHIVEWKSSSFSNSQTGTTPCGGKPLSVTLMMNRLKKEGRLLERWKGCNTESSALNFIPKMDAELLKKGYRNVIDTIYAPRNYYQRVLTFIKEYKPPRLAFRSHKSFNHVMAFIRSLWYLGIVWKHRFYYWKLLFVGLLRYPKSFPQIVVLSIYSYHFQKVVESGMYKAWK